MCVRSGMTQQSIASKLGVHRSRISLIVTRKKYGSDLERERLQGRIDRLERELMSAMDAMSDLKGLRERQHREFPLHSVTGNNRVPTAQRSGKRVARSRRFVNREPKAY